MLSPLNSKVLTAMLSLLICTQLYAFDVGPIEVNGFISAGYYRSFGNNDDHDSNDESTGFHEAAFNYGYSTGRWFSMGQIISRDIGESEVNKEDIALDYLLLGANIFNSSSFDLQFRLGQIKTPYGIMDTSDIPTMRNYPLEGYASRNLYLRSRGGVFDASYMTGIGDFDFNLGYLRPEIDGERALDLSDEVYYDAHKPYFNPVFRLKWSSIDKGIAINYSFMKLQVDHSFIQEVPAFQQHPERSIIASIYGPGSCLKKLSAVITFEKFKLITTIEKAKSKLDGELSITSPAKMLLYEGPVSKDKSIGYSVRGIYDFTSRLSIGSAYIYNFIDRKTWFMNGYDVEEKLKTLQLTLDYVVDNNWSVKGAFSHFDGVTSVVSGYNSGDINSNVMKKKWNLFEIQITYSF